MKTYRTTKIAKLIGVHANTIRFYEDMKLLPVIPRTESGYRIFNDSHLSQLRLLRVAFRAEIISSRLRHEAYEIVKTSASGDMKKAYLMTKKYLEHIVEEKARAEEAIAITIDIIENSTKSVKSTIFYGRLQTAQSLGITADVLRDWERNGLIQVPRDSRGNRSYGLEELNRLKIIRTLRNAHYSMMSILRMLKHLDQGDKNIRKRIDTPDEEEDIVCAADRYISALSMAERDAVEMLDMLEAMCKTNN